MKGSRVVTVASLRVGQRFNFIPAAWHGPAVLRRKLKAGSISFSSRNGVAGASLSIWCLKFYCPKAAYPQCVWYGSNAEKVRLLKPVK
jgi:hypothetical protein